jgi:hypothetical protein
VGKDRLLLRQGPITGVSTVDIVSGAATGMADTMGGEAPRTLAILVGCPFYRSPVRVPDRHATTDQIVIFSFKPDTAAPTADSPCEHDHRRGDRSADGHLEEHGQAGVGG